MNKLHQEETAGWKSTLNRVLPLWGHRNWIVVADSAYPAQSSPGIETIATDADHLEVPKAALDAIDKSSHVRANVYVDAEFRFVGEQSVPGVTQYRQKLVRLIGHRNPQSVIHGEIIRKLDLGSKVFRTLILKSRLAIPYSTVFLELDCGYWSQDSERHLRESMARLRIHQDEGL